MDASVLPDYFPVAMMIVAACGMAVATMLFGKLIGPSRPSAVKQAPYECGVDPIGTAKIRFSVKFSLVALLFLLFDVETVFFIIWAKVFASGEFAAASPLTFQIFAFLEMLVFVAILLAGYVYCWRKGALDWS